MVVYALNFRLKGTMFDPIYAARNATLLTMGFTNYNKYLASELWATIRKAVLERDKNQCRICVRTSKKSAKAVHHLSYSRETLEGKRLGNLIAICHGCHRRMEFDYTESNRKLSAESVIGKTKAHMKTNTKRHKSQPWIGLAHKAKHRNRNR